MHNSHEHVDGAHDLDIVMPVYNLIEYSNNFSDTSGSLWPFERDESPLTNDGNPNNVSVNNSTYFKNISSLIGESTAANNNRVFKNVEIAVPLKYLSNFWIFIEILLVNCKIHLELTDLKFV